jgi:glycosyltransferase involved in cell wall biosynthesis
MLVSIIIPCYNVEAYVGEALDSALTQSYRPIEIIAVDNNSTDRTLAVLKEYERANPNLIRILQEHKSGAPAARNKGLDYAKGEWIQFLDADDILKCNKIEQQLKLIADRRDNPGFVAAAYYRVEPNGNRIVWRPTSKAPMRSLFSSNLGQTSANLFNREYVEKAGRWREDLPCNQEYELMFRILMLGANPIFDYHPATIRRIREKSIGRSTSQEGQLISAQIRAEMLSELMMKKGPLSDEDLSFYRGAIFHFLRQHAKLQHDQSYQGFTALLPPGYIPKKTPNGRIVLWDIWASTIFGVKGYFRFVHVLYSLWLHLKKFVLVKFLFNVLVKKRWIVTQPKSP